MYIQNSLISIKKGGPKPGIEPGHGGPQPPRLPIVYEKISPHIYPTSARSSYNDDFY